MESIAIPSELRVLVCVRRLMASAFHWSSSVAILGSMTVLRAITLSPSLVFALNLSIAMGLALAIDYRLLIISRVLDRLPTVPTASVRCAPHDDRGPPVRSRR